MVLLIDTNIILDVLLSRSDFVKESSIIGNFVKLNRQRDIYLH